MNFFLHLLIFLSLLSNGFLLMADDEGQLSMPPKALKAVPANYDFLLTANLNKLTQSKYLSDFKNLLIHKLKQEWGENSQFMAIADAIGFNEKNIKALHFASRLINNLSLEVDSEEEHIEEDIAIFCEFKRPVNLETIINFAKNKPEKSSSLIIEMIDGTLCYGDKEDTLIAYQATKNSIAIVSRSCVKETLMPKTKNLYNNENTRSLYKKAPKYAFSILTLLNKKTSDSVNSISGHVTLNKAQSKADVTISTNTAEQAQIFYNQLQLYISILKKNKNLSQTFSGLRSSLIEKNITINLPFEEKNLDSFINLSNNGLNFSIDLNKNVEMPEQPQNKNGEK